MILRDTASLTLGPSFFMALGASQGSGRSPPTHKLLFSKASPSLLHSPQLFSSPVESISLGPLSLLGLLQSILPISRCPTAVKWTQFFRPLSHIGPLEAQSFLLYATDSSSFFSRSWMLTETPAPLLGSVSLDSCPAAFCLYTQASSSN